MTTRTKFFLVTGAIVTSLFLYRKQIQTEVDLLLQHPNIAAFLRAIRSGESSQGPEAYHMVYGASYFQDLRDHPYLTGEWDGEELPADWCIAAGYDPGCITTAAGAYQTTVTDWRIMQPLLGLPDFSEISQDKYAVGKLKQKNAVDDILNGNISSAINKVNRVWASLPGSNYGQPTAELNNWLGVFENYGGTVLA